MKTCTRCGSYAINPNSHMMLPLWKAANERVKRLTCEQS